MDVADPEMGTYNLCNISLTNTILDQSQRYTPTLLAREGVSNIGIEIGELENYEVTKSSARIRCVIDGLKPLVMETVLEFDSGEESMISLEYEKLGNHCTYGFRLTHLQSQCPEKPIEMANKEGRNVVNSPPLREDKRELPLDRETMSREETRNSSFRERVDRHGNPFGERVSLASNRGQGPRNKISPYSSLPRSHQEVREYRPKKSSAGSLAPQNDRKEQMEVSPVDVAAPSRPQPSNGKGKLVRRVGHLLNDHRSNRR